MPSRWVWLTALVTLVGAGAGALADLKSSRLADLVTTLPRWVVALTAGIAVAVAFIVGAFASLAASRRGRRAVLYVRSAEQRLIRAQEEMAAIQQAVADRTVEYAELGRRIQDAAQMLALTEGQTASVRKEVERAVSRTQRAWWLSFLAFLAGAGISYLIEWTADGLKPSWLS